MMKISKERLKEIIKEEMAVGVVGGESMHDLPHSSKQHEYTGGNYPKDPHGYEGEMAKTNLWKISQYAQEMHELIHDDEDLEPWVEEKIAVAAYMMDQIGHHLEYMKQRGHEDAEGKPGHVDFKAPEHGEHEEDEEEMIIGDDLYEG